MASSAKLIAASIVLAGSGALFAQSDRANLTGTVTDQSGATVPGATVTATHVATNASRTATSSAVGEFVLPQLVVGEYRLTTEAPGFKVSVNSGSALHTGRHCARRHHPATWSGVGIGTGHRGSQSASNRFGASQYSGYSEIRGRSAPRGRRSTPLTARSCVCCTRSQKQQ